MENKDKLVFENSVYSLLLFIFYHKRWRECDYVFFGERLPCEVRKNLQKELHKGASVAEISLSLKGRSLFSYLKMIYDIRSKSKKYDEIIGNVRELTVFEQKKTTQISDGLMTNMEFINAKYYENISLIKRFMLIILMRRRIFFRHPNKYLFEKKSMNKIKLSTNVDTASHEIISDVDIQRCWNGLSDDDKNTIKRIFNFKLDSKSLLGRKVMLVTQPLSEEGMCLFNDKIEGYKRLVDDMAIDYSQLVVKPHPREKNDYSVIFPGALILEAQFPIELVFVEGIDIEKVITLWSSISDFVPTNISLYFLGNLDYFNLSNSIPKYQRYIRE